MNAELSDMVNFFRSHPGFGMSFLSLVFVGLVLAPIGCLFSGSGRSAKRTGKRGAR